MIEKFQAMEQEMEHEQERYEDEAPESREVPDETRDRPAANVQQPMASPSHSMTQSQHSAQILTPKEVKILETAEDIQERRQQVLGRYENFKVETRRKRDRLEDSRRYQYFKRDADELESWIYEKLQAASDETFKDATNLQAKIQKHQVKFIIINLTFPV